MAEKFDVDKMIATLLKVKKSKKGTLVNLKQEDIFQLLDIVREIFMSQPMLLEVSAPINVCGDTHGQFLDLMRLFEMGKFPPAANYLFLGDYVDRADQSLETICLLLCYKVKYSENFFSFEGQS